MKFQNFIVLNFAKQPIGRFKIYKRRSRRVSVVLYLASRKVIKFSGTQGVAEYLKAGGTKCERDKKNERKADRREK